MQPFTDDLKTSIKDELKHISPEQICLNPHQPRKEFKAEELEELAQSISSVGFIHPPLVRALVGQNRFELISGERRFRAAQLLQLKTIPVFIRHVSSHLSAQAALIENIQRVNLNPLEIARALKTLMEEFALNQDLLANKIGKKRSTIANYLRLLTLPSPLQQSLKNSMISMGHAKAILSLSDTAKQLLLHELILRDDLSVRETEAKAKKLQEKSQKKRLKHVTRDFYVEHLENLLRDKLGTKVSIQSKGKQGRLTIDYYHANDLDRLLNLLGIELN